MTDADLGGLCVCARRTRMVAINGVTWNSLWCDVAGSWFKMLAVRAGMI